MGWFSFLRLPILPTPLLPFLPLDSTYQTRKTTPQKKKKKKKKKKKRKKKLLFRFFCSRPFPSDFCLFLLCSSLYPFLSSSLLTFSSPFLAPCSFFLVTSSSENYVIIEQRLSSLPLLPLSHPQCNKRLFPSDMPILREALCYCYLFFFPSQKEGRKKEG